MLPSLHGRIMPSLRIQCCVKSTLHESSKIYPYPRRLAGPDRQFWGSKRNFGQKTHWKRWEGGGTPPHFPMVFEIERAIQTLEVDDFRPGQPPRISISFGVSLMRLSYVVARPYCCGFCDVCAASQRRRHAPPNRSALLTRLT